jgi:hypothetical protein
MSKSMITTVNSLAQTVTAGNIIPLGTTVRRFGCNCRQDGNTIANTGKGYYTVLVSVTATPAAAGTITVTAKNDGVDIIGATGSATVAAVSTTTNIAVVGTIRNYNDCETSSLSIVLTGADAVINNMTVKVIKE